MARPIQGNEKKESSSLRFEPKVKRKLIKDFKGLQKAIDYLIGEYFKQKKGERRGRKTQI